jgi:hypothetical protein
MTHTLYQDIKLSIDLSNFAKEHPEIWWHTLDYKDQIDLYRIELKTHIKVLENHKSEILSLVRLKGNNPFGTG